MKTEYTLEDFLDEKTLRVGGESMEGKLYETYGKYVEPVKAADPDKVWTLLDDEQCTVIKGCHFVNRLGYFIEE